MPYFVVTSLQAMNCMFTWTNWHPIGRSSEVLPVQNRSSHSSSLCSRSFKIKIKLICVALSGAMCLPRVQQRIDRDRFRQSLNHYSVKLRYQSPMRARSSRWPVIGRRYGCTMYKESQRLFKNRLCRIEKFIGHQRYRHNGETKDSTPGQDRIVSTIN